MLYFLEDKLNNCKVKGYIISETTTRGSLPVIIKEDMERDPNRGLIIKTVLQEAEIQNRNKRVYQKAVLDKSLQAEYVQERLRTKTFYGEAGHPIKPEIHRQLYIDLARVSHRINSYWWEGNLLKGYVEATRTPMGDSFANLIKQGSQVAFSLRGVGPVTENYKGALYVKSPLMIYCYDWVIHPSHKTAYMDSIVSESLTAGNALIAEEAPFMVPLYEFDQVEEYLKSNSKNLKIFSEQLELDINKKNLYLANDLHHIYIKEEGATAIVRTEDFIIQELNNSLINLGKKK